MHIQQAAARITRIVNMVLQRMQRSPHTLVRVVGQANGTKIVIWYKSPDEEEHCFRNNNLGLDMHEAGFREKMHTKANC